MLSNLMHGALSLVVSCLYIILMITVVIIMRIPGTSLNRPALFPRISSSRNPRPADWDSACPRALAPMSVIPKPNPNP